MSEGNSARESEFRNQSPKPPSWVNLLLLGATFACLALVLLFLYRGWKTEQAHRLLAFGTGSHFIADITVNLAGIPYQEHCLTCHPQGKGVRFSGRGLVFQDHPAIGSHSMDALGCTSCHLGEGMARDLVLSHGVPGGEARKVLVGEELQSSCYRCHELKALPGAEKLGKVFCYSAKMPVIPATMLMDRGAGATVRI